MKEELYVILSGNKRRKLDLNTPSGITMKWVSNLFCDLSKLTCSYSYTFKLPITRNNREIMDMAEDIRHTSSFAKKRMDALFVLNGVEICKNANLYLSEVSDKNYSCVMTWGVLTAFQKLKDSGAKLKDLTALDFLIRWDDDSANSLLYGEATADTTNRLRVVYPDYDAGVPHVTGTPPKPCVPLFALIELIKEQYGVKFDIGKEAFSFGLTPMSQYNKKKDGKRVYDDYITNGVLPLVKTNLDSETAGVFGLSAVSFYWQSLWQVDYSQTFDYDNFDDDISTEKVMFVNAPVFSWNGSEDSTAVLQPLYLSSVLTKFYGSIRPPEEQTSFSVRASAPPPVLPPPPPPPTEPPYFTISIPTFGNKQRTDRFPCQCIGFKALAECEVYGSFKVKIKKEAVTLGRVNLDSYWWVSVCKAKKNMWYDCDYDSYSEGNKLELKQEIEWETVSAKDVNSWIGLQSVSLRYDETEQVYIYQFDMGRQYVQRRLKLSASDEEDDFGYFFLPYFDEDYRYGENGQYLKIQRGDVIFTDFVIDKIVPVVEFSVLPATMNVAQNLPDMTCFDFFKAIIYMNGGVPYVKEDGETIAVMYYNEMRDKIWDGDVVDWSKKIFGDYDEQPSSIKMSSNSFGQKNYFEMAYTTREKTADDLKDEVNVYEEGCATMRIDDFTLAEEKTIYKSPFYPPYKQDIRFPLVQTGNTTKIWSVYNELTEEAKPIYGFVSLRGIDSSFEAVTMSRHAQAAHGADYQHVRMTTFSIVDRFEELFGYLQTVLNNYTLIKEKFRLDEFDLKELDLTRPIYLDKYNSYFALSSLQRDSKGVCTAELIRLPVVEPPTDE